MSRTHAGHPLSMSSMLQDSVLESRTSFVLAKIIQIEGKAKHLLSLRQTDSVRWRSQVQTFSKRLKCPNSNDQGPSWSGTEGWGKQQSTCYIWGETWSCLMNAHFTFLLLGLESDEQWIVNVNMQDLIQQLAHLKLLGKMALQLPPVQPRNGLQKSPHWEAAMTT